MSNSEQTPTTGLPISHYLPSGKWADWSKSTAVPQICVACGREIVPRSDRGEAMTTHSKWFGSRGPFHIGCQEQAT